MRTVKEPVSVGGRRLERGDPALLLVAAANRDPAALRWRDHINLRGLESLPVSAV